MVKEKIDQVLDEISSMKEDISSMKGDISSTKGDISSMKGDISSMKGDISSTKGDVSSLKEGQKKNYDLIQQNGIKIEQIASDVKAVAEGHQVIRSEMRQMEQRLVEKIEENKSAVKFAAKQIGDKLDQHMRQPAHV